MLDFGTIVQVAMIVIVCLIFCAVIALIFTPEIEQLKSNRRGRDAHAGKVECEEKNCEVISTHVTPNGYYCKDHWLMNSRRKAVHGQISYGHMLQYMMKGK